MPENERKEIQLKKVRELYEKLGITFPEENDPELLLEESLVEEDRLYGSNPEAYRAYSFRNRKKLRQLIQELEKGESFKEKTDKEKRDQMEELSRRMKISREVLGKQSLKRSRYRDLKRGIYTTTKDFFFDRQDLHAKDSKRNYQERMMITDALKMYEKLKEDGFEILDDFEILEDEELEGWKEPESSYMASAASHAGFIASSRVRGGLSYLSNFFPSSESDEQNK